jgi:SAM-dependent methyltransferase
MIPLDYWVLRLARRATPQRVVDLLLDRGLYLKPGRDTSEPDRVVAEYAARAAALGQPLAGRTVGVVGYGGGFGVGLALLEAGAAHVVLQDPFAPVRRARNRTIPDALRRRYFSGDRPDPSRVTLVHEPLAAHAARHPASIDLVVSSSVLEHVADLDEVLAACAMVTRPGGLGIHTIDLRDHYFRRPFEMLCYSEATWNDWLDASNHLNRLRLPAYERAFRRHFATVEVAVLEHLHAELAAARPRIRPEFLAGDPSIDAAAIVRVECRRAPAP